MIPSMAGVNEKGASVVAIDEKRHGVIVIFYGCEAAGERVEHIPCTREN